jgi:hypothetical protein
MIFSKEVNFHGLDGWPIVSVWPGFLRGEAPTVVDSLTSDRPSSGLLIAWKGSLKLSSSNKAVLNAGSIFTHV